MFSYKCKLKGISSGSTTGGTEGGVPNHPGRWSGGCLAGRRAGAGGHHVMLIYTLAS